MYFLQRSAGGRPPLNETACRRLSSPFLFLLLPTRWSRWQTCQHRIAISFHPGNAGHTPHHLATETAAKHALHHAPHLSVLLDQRIHLGDGSAGTARDAAAP